MGGFLVICQAYLFPAEAGSSLGVLLREMFRVGFRVLMYNKGIKGLKGLFLILL
jgi:hypothetical protein